LRFDYKIIPLPKPEAAFPGVTFAWMPMLPIKLSYGHGRQTPRIEALVDSGATDCLFSADIAAFLNIKLEKGVHSTMGGLVDGPKIDIYYHDVNLWVGADKIRIRAAFANGMSIKAILGRRGFFENFIITFDPAATPPGFDIQRLGRA
jgi:hypothetical protein